MDLSLPQLIAVFAVPVIFAITLHEAAHGYVASLLGDNTARLAGRVTANPLKHIDPVGTIAVPGLILLVSKLTGAGLALFGWAKPVPVVYSNLRRPRRDMGLVAAAGPGSNVLMAFGWALFARLMLGEGEVARFAVLVGLAGVQVNLILALLNLLPVPPLDGGRIVTSLLPPRLAIAYARLEPYGLVILVALLVTGVLGRILFPMIAWSTRAVLTLTGL
jgi:Zn-dependent protease